MTAADQTAREGSATGGVLSVLRLEGLAVFLAATTAYGWVGGSWLVFALLFLAPDLSMFGYLANPRIGAAAYNLVHAYVLPLALALFGLVARRPELLALALIWVAHIGIDRALGYGLKYAARFGATHLLTFGGR